MNNIVIKGRLTADCDIKFFNEDKTVNNFCVAVNRRFKKDGQPTADFFNCVAFGKTAEIIDKYFRKGNEIVVNGYMQSDTYEKDGQKRTAWKLIVDHFDFCGSSNTQSANIQDNIQEKDTVTNTTNFTVEDAEDEDMPF